MPRSSKANVVVDASVAVKWVVSEEHSDIAQTLLEGDVALSAPAHWLAEAATGLWGACRRGELSALQAQERVALLVGAPVAAAPLHHLATAAMGLALRLNLTIYDTVYLGLAEEQDARLVTADRRLFVVSGASSVPCLTAAVIDHYRPGFMRLTRSTTASAPRNRPIAVSRRHRRF